MYVYRVIGQGHNGTGCMAEVTGDMVVMDMYGCPEDGDNTDRRQIKKQRSRCNVTA